MIIDINSHLKEESQCSAFVLSDKGSHKVSEPEDRPEKHEVEPHGALITASSPILQNQSWPDQ